MGLFTSALLESCYLQIVADEIEFKGMTASSLKALHDWRLESAKQLDQLNMGSV
jgi:hypothetical protein